MAIVARDHRGGALSSLEHAVTTVLGCVGIAAEKDLLVVTDPACRVIADALVQAARDLGAETVLVEMAERETHGTEPPREVAAAMSACDVLIAPTTKSLSHTEARHLATEKGIRVATMPGITEDMLVRTMNADYEEVARLSDALARALTGGSEVRVTSAAGTDVIFDVDGRNGIADDGNLTARGAFGNLPAGEGFVAPVEGRTNGRIAFDGSMASLGILDEPLVATIEKGYATGFSGPRADELTSLLDRYGPAAFAVAELGIGTNRAATLTGNILEDEKILGTIHVAFGDNHSIGGTIRVPSHQDGVVLDAGVAVDGVAIMDSGRLLI
ncbi:MAG: aminopeptidase [Actinomycetota bacterium]